MAWKWLVCGRGCAVVKMGTQVILVVMAGVGGDGGNNTSDDGGNALNFVLMLLLGATILVNELDKGLASTPPFRASMYQLVNQSHMHPHVPPQLANARKAKVGPIITLRTLLCKTLVPHHQSYHALLQSPTTI